MSNAFGNLLAPPTPKTRAELEEDYRLHQIMASQSEQAAVHDAKIARHAVIKARHHEEERERER